MQFIDWVVLVAFVLPTAVFACLWAARDLRERSRHWAVRLERRGMAAYWMRDGGIVLLWIGAAVVIAAAFRLLFR